MQLAPKGVLKPTLQGVRESTVGVMDGRQRQKRFHRNILTWKFISQDFRRHPQTLCNAPRIPAGKTRELHQGPEQLEKSPVGVGGRRASRPGRRVDPGGSGVDGGGESTDRGDGRRGVEGTGAGGPAGAGGAGAWGNGVGGGRNTQLESEDGHRGEHHRGRKGAVEKRN